MPFQSTLNTYPAPGAPGLREGLNPMAYLLPVPVAATAGVTVGNAVFFSTGRTSVTNAAPSGTTTIAGIAVREMLGQITGTAEATNVIAAGRPVAVAIKGDLWVTSAAAVTVGQKVFASTTTGALTGGAAGATVSGSVETPWTIQETAAAGTPFVISNWS